MKSFGKNGKECRINSHYKLPKVIESRNDFPVTAFDDSESNKSRKLVKPNVSHDVLGITRKFCELNENYLLPPNKKSNLEKDLMLKNLEFSPDKNSQHSFAEFDELDVKFYNDEILCDSLGAPERDPKLYCDNMEPDDKIKNVFNNYSSTMKNMNNNLYSNFDNPSAWKSSFLNLILDESKCPVRSHIINHLKIDTKTLDSSQVYSFLIYLGKE